MKSARRHPVQLTPQVSTVADAICPFIQHYITVSPLSEPPQTPPPVDLQLEAPPAEPQVEGEAGAAADEAAESAKEKKPRKEKKQIFDAVTELADGPGARRGRGGVATLPAPRDVSGITVPPRYVPRDPLVARLLQIREDPLAHFLPKVDGKQLICVAPPGLAPELASMFLRPARGASIQSAAAKRRAEAQEEEAAAKKRRVGSAAPGEEEPEPLENVRRESREPSVALGSHALGARMSVPPEGQSFELDLGGDVTLGGDDFQMELPADIELPRAGSEAPSVRSRLSTPGADEDEGVRGAAPECAIAAFDVRQSQTQSQASEEVEEKEDGKGYSRNTVKALAMIRRELQPTEEESEPVMSYKNMANKVRAFILVFKGDRSQRNRRPRVVRRQPSSLSFLFSVHATVSTSTSPHPSMTSTSVLRTSCGNVKHAINLPHHLWPHPWPQL
jgi:cohesin complex subunit SCC1